MSQADLHAGRPARRVAGRGARAEWNERAPAAARMNARARARWCGVVWQMQMLSCASVGGAGGSKVKAVRYAWSNFPECVLFDQNQLPVGPFLLTVN